MKITKLKDTIGGWFVGNFDKAAFKSDMFEVSYKFHKKDEIWDNHYHEHVTEINLLTHGTMILQGKTLIAGDIFVLEPYEIADPKFLTDCEIVCVKYPGVTNDKVVFYKNENNSTQG
ncbi:hypothetical protein UFOVP204_102 [uncultured Caudovirales phage]|uniref:Cupin n=1 Tax=uncultured Caudovirales phage TaxID=2100421 RepID=A0A6J7WK86_9CAUD|nr:hypothetical protein UFOVP204_102 [uncultured Caudovirales phage]